MCCAQQVAQPWYLDIPIQLGIAIWKMSVQLVSSLLRWLSLQPSAGSSYRLHLQALIGVMLYAVNPQFHKTDQQATECGEISRETSVLTVHAHQTCRM